jgi:3-oxoacyl-[acyl-carrier protein] reductase
MLLESKIALVTGGAQGIGAGIAQRLAQEGAQVIITDVDDDAGAEAQTALGDRVEFLHMDVSDPDDVVRGVDEIVQKHSTVDILVNNAGITNDKLLLRMTKDDWDRVLAVNLTGTFLVTKAVSRVMIKQRYGRIINITSVVGLVGNAGQANYAASKGGVIAFTKSCAKELGGRNITVNAIAPGYIETRMTESMSEEAKQSFLKSIPLGRAGQPADVANLALFLSSDRSSYVTGQVICVDGGMVM